MDNLSKKGRLLKAVFQMIEPGTLEDLIDGPGGVTVVLRDGRRFLAWLDGDNSLRLDEIGEAC